MPAAPLGLAPHVGAGSAGTAGVTGAFRLRKSFFIKAWDAQLRANGQCSPEGCWFYHLDKTITARAGGARRNVNTHQRVCVRGWRCGWHVNHHPGSRGWKGRRSLYSTCSTDKGFPSSSACYRARAPWAERPQVVPASVLGEGRGSQQMEGGANTQTRRLHPAPLPPRTGSALRCLLKGLAWLKEGLAASQWRVKSSSETPPKEKNKREGKKFSLCAGCVKKHFHTRWHLSPSLPASLGRSQKAPENSL